MTALQKYHLGLQILGTVALIGYRFYLYQFGPLAAIVDGTILAAIWISRERTKK